MLVNLIYYEPPTDAIFTEVKEKAIEIWKTYDNQFGYVDEKVNNIKNIANVRDNMMYIVAMFDLQNQHKLADKLSVEAKKAIRIRMLEYGYFNDEICF